MSKNSKLTSNQPLLTTQALDYRLNQSQILTEKKKLKEGQMLVRVLKMMMTVLRMMMRNDNKRVTNSRNLKRDLLILQSTSRMEKNF
jgi:hypothetical protein